MHLKTEQQSWIVSSMLDVFGVLLVSALLLLVLLFWLIAAGVSMVARWGNSWRKGAKQL